MSPVLDAYLDRINELKKGYMEHLISGAVANYDEYRHICGVLKGLASAEMELKELMSKTDED